MFLRVAFVGLAASACWGGCWAAKPPKMPAILDIAVAPDTVVAGEHARVTLKIKPIEGVKINRYPMIKLKVPAQEGLVLAAQAEIGNSSPPPPDQLDANYYKTVDSLELDLPLEAGISSGKHEIEANLTYFYCVSKSGFCAPARVAVTIPLAVK